MCPSQQKCGLQTRKQTHRLAPHVRTLLTIPHRTLLAIPHCATLPFCAKMDLDLSDEEAESFIFSQTQPFLKAISSERLSCTLCKVEFDNYPSVVRFFAVLSFFMERCKLNLRDVILVAYIFLPSADVFFCSSSTATHTNVPHAARLSANRRLSSPARNGRLQIQQPPRSRNAKSPQAV
jgi:hypothetical protein